MDLTAKREVSALKGAILIITAPTMQTPTQIKARKGRADLSPAKNLAGARMINADSAAKESLLTGKKAALRSAFTTEILKGKIAARATTAENPTLKNKNLLRFL